MIGRQIKNFIPILLKGLNGIHQNCREGFRACPLSLYQITLKKVYEAHGLPCGSALYGRKYVYTLLLKLVWRPFSNFLENLKHMYIWKLFTISLY